MPTSKTVERLSARIPSQVYELIAQAAELTGATLNQFLVQAAQEKAAEIIKKEHEIQLTLKSANVFFDAIENPPEPNRKLMDAVRMFKETIQDDLD